MIKQVVAKLDMPKGTMNISDVNENKTIVIKCRDKFFMLVKPAWREYFYQDLNDSSNRIVYNFSTIKEALEWALQKEYPVYVGDTLFEILTDKGLVNPGVPVLKVGMYVLLKGIKAHESYDSTGVTRDMEQFGGKIQKISEVCSPDSFHIETRGTNWYYNAKMIEKIVEITPGMKFKLLNDVNCFEAGETVTVKYVYSNDKVEVYTDDRDHTHDAKVSDLALILEFKVGQKAEVINTSGHYFF
jgi:hypothetical protein